MYDYLSYGINLKKKIIIAKPSIQTFNYASVMDYRSSLIQIQLLFQLCTTISLSSCS